MSKSRFASLSVASFLLLVLFAVSYAQSGSSTVQGTVKDPQGNLVSGATVTSIASMPSACSGARMRSTGLSPTSRTPW